MACGCNKSKTKNRKSLVNKGKKTAARRSMPLVTIRKRVSGAKKKTAKK